MGRDSEGKKEKDREKESKKDSKKRDRSADRGEDRDSGRRKDKDRDKDREKKDRGRSRSRDGHVGFYLCIFSYLLSFVRSSIFILFYFTDSVKAKEILEIEIEIKIGIEIGIGIKISLLTERTRKEKRIAKERFVKYLPQAFNLHAIFSSGKTTL